MKKVFLQPGEIDFERDPSCITTIVGSCISVCIWDREMHFGGMCHYYLPKRNNKLAPDNNYGEFAISNLLKRFKEAGSHRGNLVAKVLGGGHVIDVNLPTDRDVGETNIKIALDMLDKFRIPIVAKATGGNFGKKVSFDTDTGSVAFQDIRSQKGKLAESKKIKVLIIDDSKPIRLILRKIIERDPEFEIVGDAEDPVSALKIIDSTKPDVLTLDLKMPIMDGVTYLKTHWQKNPIPTIVVTALSTDDSRDVFDAIELGAFDYIRKPTFEDIEGLTFDFHQKLKAAHETKGKIKRKTDVKAAAPVVATRNEDLIPVTRTKTSLILIGSSTGGTEVVKDILSKLPSSIPPILVVQHMPGQFTTQFAQRLSQLCRFRVLEASHNMYVESNTAYIAPGGKQMAVKELLDGRLQIQITDDPPMNRFKPSVDYLYLSALKIKKQKLLAIILTGMGSDGAKGMAELKKMRAHTIAQDEASSVVFGMPKAAIEMGAVCEIKSQDSIPGAILSWINKN